MAITDWPVQETSTERLLALRRRSPPTPSCSRSCFVPDQGKERGRPCTPAARRFGSVGRLSMRDPRTSRRPRVWGRQARAAPAALELARRAPRRNLLAKCVVVAASSARLTCALRSPDASRKSSPCCSSDAQHRVIAYESCSRHADPDERLPAQRRIRRGFVTAARVRPKDIRCRLPATIENASST